MLIAVGKESLLEAQQGVKTRIDNLIDINISREVQSIQQWGDKYIAGAADKLNQINAAAEAEYQMGYMLQEKRLPRNWFLCQANNPTAHTGSGTF